MTRAGLLSIAVVVAACGSRTDADVTLWHAYSGAERAALEALADDWNHAHPDQSLAVVAVPYDGFGDKLTSAIPNGNGPDLFIYSQDRLGDWTAAGILEPIEFWIDDATAARFAPDALATMAYRGSLWGLPLAVKSLALFVRTDLVPEPPRTTDALIAMAPGFRARGIFPLAYPVDDLYAHAAWLHGHGGRVMDGDQPTIATAPGVAAAGFARELVVRGVVPRDADGALTATLFSEGKAAMALSGPWFVADIAAGVPWTVTTLPIVSATGEPAAPFLGAEGVLMSARARDKQAAIAIVLALTDDAAATRRATAAHQVVPNPAAYTGALAADPVLRAFRDQLAHTVPMPASPAMRAVWTPYKNALGQIVSGATSPADGLERAASEIATYARAERR